jgi:hypothetical protein
MKPNAFISRAIVKSGEATGVKTVMFKMPVV